MNPKPFLLSDTILNIIVYLQSFDCIITGSFVLTLLRIYKNPGDIDIILDSMYEEVIRNNLPLVLGNDFKLEKKVIKYQGTAVIDLIFLKKTSQIKTTTLSYDKTTFRCLKLSNLHKRYECQVDDEERIERGKSKADSIKAALLEKYLHDNPEEEEESRYISLVNPVKRTLFF